MPTLTPKEELQKILTTTDASHIDQVQFFPKQGMIFTSSNENIKKLALYISISLKKKEFAPGELKRAFGFVVQNLDSELPTKEYQEIHDHILTFITEGGRIEFSEKGFLAGVLDREVVSKNTEKVQPKEPKAPSIHHPENVDTKQGYLTKPLIIENPPPQEEKKALTWKNFFMGMFVIGPLSGLISSMLTTPMMSFLDLRSSNTLFSLFGIGLILAPIIFIGLSKAILGISTRGGLVLFMVIAFINLGMFAAACGGMLLVFNGL